MGMLRDSDKVFVSEEIERLIDQLEFSVGSVVGGIVRLTQTTMPTIAVEDFKAVLSELRARVTTLPLRAHRDGRLDLSQIPEGGRARLETFGSIVLRILLGVPAETKSEQ